MTIYDIRRGSTFVLDNFGHPTTIHARKVFEYDGAMHVTDETGHVWHLYPEDRVHPAH